MEDKDSSQKKIDSKINHFTLLLIIWLFSTQLFYTILVEGIAKVLKADDVLTAQVRQSVNNMVLLGSFFMLSFYFFTPKEFKHKSYHGNVQYFG